MGLVLPCVVVPKDMGYGLFFGDSPRIVIIYGWISLGALMVDMYIGGG